MATLSLDAEADAKKRRVDAAAEKSKAYRPLSEEELKLELKVYYDRLFPTSFLFHWLATQAPADGLKYREMSFTLPGDIYVRYCSYLTKEALKSDLVSKLPVKIDIGAVYNAPPNMHASIAHFAPVNKELVFDIDMTDYDDIRTCCSGAAVCDKVTSGQANCWVLMSAGLKVLHTLLTRDFGFEHILWVFSGRRGIHAWICDSRARTLTHDQRSAIVDYLSVYGGKEKRVLIGNSIHPSMQRAYEQLLPYFEDLLDSQGWFSTPAQCGKILDTYLDASLRGEFDSFASDEDPDEEGVSRWHRLQQLVRSYNAKVKNKFSTPAISVRTLLQRIVFAHVYPRLDVNVSKHLNHLLKSPFCVHPKTGRVCVPIDPALADGFDVAAVPHVLQLHEQLNTAAREKAEAAAADGADGGEEGSGKARTNWRDTSLEPYIEYFRRFVTGLMNASRAENPRSYAKLAGMNAQQEVNAAEAF